MAKRPGSTNVKRRIPKLCHTTNRKIGWHVHYRDPETGIARRYRFGMVSEQQAKALYNTWLARHLSGETNGGEAGSLPKARGAGRGRVQSVPGSVLEVASSLLSLLEESVRKDGAPRSRGTISRPVFTDREKHIKDFLAFVNERHGAGTVARMLVADIEMADVEAFNRKLVDAGYSDSQVAKRIQMVKRIIDRAGRPEHGQQRLPWNWDSRDTAHGKPTRKRRLPKVKQLEKLIAATGLRGRTLIWLGIGLGFGAHDLSALRVGQIDNDTYDLRRGKTGVERFGETPPLVWSLVNEYAETEGRPTEELLFLTRKGQPLVHRRSNAVTQWWAKLRKRVGEKPETLSGFYVLRHLGATEFGSRPGTSIAVMKRWLGHSASSQAADIYMRPVPPEYREVIEWVRERLSDNG